MARNLETTESVNITRYSFRFWRGKALVKSTGRGTSPRKIGDAPRKFSSVAILPEIRVSENSRKRKREKEREREETSASFRGNAKLRGYFRITFSFFSFLSEAISYRRAL